MNIAQRLNKVERLIKPKQGGNYRTLEQFEEWETVFLEVAKVVHRYRTIESGSLCKKLHQELEYDRNGKESKPFLYNKEERKAMLDNARARNFSFYESGKHIADKILKYPEIEQYFDMDLLQKETSETLAEHYLAKLRELDDFLYKEWANDY